MNACDDGMRLEEAQALITGTYGLLGTETVPLDDATGRVVARDVVSDLDYPSLDLSMVDGYCFDHRVTLAASETCPAVLRLIGAIRAGQARSFSLGAGECGSVMTGAPIPEGADSVVRAEDIETRGQSIFVRKAVAPGDRVRKAGEVAKKGEIVVHAGQLITHMKVGSLAAFAGGRVCVARKPRVAVIATGDELVPCDVNPGPGFVRNSNGAMLMSLLADLRCEARDMGISRDTERDLLGKLGGCNDCDLVVLTGGTGGGTHDVVMRCLEKTEMNILFKRLRIRPGRSAIFARERKRGILCLPGNPISTLILFHVLVKPALLSMLGARPVVASAIKVGLAVELRKDSELPLLMLSRLRPDLTVVPVPMLGSGDVRSLASADSLLRLEEGTVSLRPGDMVEVFPLGRSEYSPGVNKNGDSSNA
jgi:molybdopterin molybdotransferase